MKKTISIFVAIFILLFLISCNGEVEESGFDSDFIGNDATNDLLGYDFVMRDYDHGGTYDIIPVYGENMLDDMMLERYKEIANRYECSVSTVEGSSADLIIMIATGQDKYADVMYDKINNAYGAVKVGAYLNVLDIDNLDITSGNFGALSLIDSMTWNGECFVLYPSTWANHFAHTMFYIPRVLKQAGLSDPHELIENDRWTWDSFSEMAKEYSGEDKYITSLTSIVVDEALYSNGVQWTTVNDKGNRVIDFNNTKTYDTLDYLKGLYISGYLDNNQAWEDNAINFMKGKTAYYSNYSWMGISKDGGYIPTHLEEEFYWTYFPVGPNGTKPSGVLTFTNPFFFITSMTDTDVIGEFCTVLFRPLGDDESSWFDVFYRENFFDRPSYDYYMDMLGSITFDYSIFIDKTTIIDDKFLSASRGTTASSEAVNAIAQSAQTNLDSYFSVVSDN